MQEIRRGFRGKIDDHFNSSNEIEISVTVAGGGAYDSCCFGVDANDKLSADDYMVFYNKTSSPKGEITLSGSGADTKYKVDLSKLPAHISKLVFTVSIDGAGVMSQIQRLQIAMRQGGETLSLTLTGADFRDEKAVIGIEVYKKDVWRVAAVASGFNGGLSALLKHFGGKEIEPAPVPPAPVPPTPAAAVKPSKIELKKGQKVSLEKSASKGEILINLNWTQSGQNPVDLDLACMIECMNGNKHLVQALGDRFGSMDDEPYVTLDGDDRTGAAAGGENLRVNGKMMDKIKRMLVFTFIYEGAANWRGANGVVTIKYPGGGDIIVRMDEHSTNQKMCAIAEFVNVQGTLQAEKLVRFFDVHREMDKTYGRGFRWVAGSKN